MRGRSAAPHARSLLLDLTCSTATKPPMMRDEAVLHLLLYWEHVPVCDVLRIACAVRASSHVADARSFSTLRAALAAAALAIDTEDAKPWIITESGDILAPGWIRANTGSRRLQ